MDFMLGIIFAIIGTVIEGAFGMVAWNMAIPVIFEGAPTITLLQAIAIAFVISIMTYGGSAYKDEVESESSAVKGLVRILLILLSSSITLGILWIFMHMFF